MKIGIIILIYECPDNLFFRNLSMIENQIYDKEKYQVQTYIVIDDQKDYKHILQFFPNVKIIKNETNLGESKSRNKGIKIATEDGCDYFTIFDRDDCFYSTISLNSLITNIFDNDIIISKILWEKEKNNFIVLDNDELWDHGCLYSCKFIIENNIIFPDNPHNNDIVFNFQCYSINNVKINYIDDITYSYNYYEKSDNHINNDAYKGNNARQLMENYSQIFPALKQNKRYNDEQAKSFIQRWFIKYYLTLSRGSLSIEKWDLWRALPTFLVLFDNFLSEKNFDYKQQTLRYKQVKWEPLKKELPLFTLDEFIALIKSNYLPDIEKC